MLMIRQAGQWHQPLGCFRLPRRGKSASFAVEKEVRVTAALSLRDLGVRRVYRGDRGVTGHSGAEQLRKQCVGSND